MPNALKASPHYFSKLLYETDPIIWPYIRGGPSKPPYQQHPATQQKILATESQYGVLGWFEMNWEVRKRRLQIAQVLSLGLQPKYVVNSDKFCVFSGFHFS